MDIKERIEEYLLTKDITINKFEKMIGASSSYWRKTKNISAEVIGSIFQTFPDLSAEWVMRGEGSMTITGDKNETVIDCEAEELKDDETPIVPYEIAKQPNVDIYNWMKENRDSVEHKTLSQLFPNHDLFATAMSNDMQPSIDKGDILVLNRVDMSRQTLDGGCYMVDTRDLGLIMRIVYDKGDYYELKATHPNFTTMRIDKSSVYNLYAMVAIIKFSLTPFLLNEDIKAKDSMILSLTEQNRDLTKMMMKIASK